MFVQPQKRRKVSKVSGAKAKPKAPKKCHPLARIWKPPQGVEKKYGEAAEYGGQGGQRRKKARNKISGKCSTFEAGKRRHDIRGYG